LDPRSDRYRRHTHHIEPAWDGVNRSRFNDLTGSVEADEVFISLNREAICRPVEYGWGAEKTLSAQCLSS